MRKRSGRRTALLVSLAALGLLVALAWTNWAEIRFFLEFESLDDNAQSYREYRHRETGIVFVRVPGGTFSMGPSKEETKRVIAVLVAHKEFKASEALRSNTPLDFCGALNGS